MEKDRLEIMDERIDQIALENRSLDIRITKLEVKNDGRKYWTNLRIWNQCRFRNPFEIKEKGIETYNFNLFNF